MSMGASHDDILQHALRNTSENVLLQPYPSCRLPRGIRLATGRKQDAERDVLLTQNNSSYVRTSVDLQAHTISTTGLSM